MKQQKYITNIDISHVEKRLKPSKHYVYCLWITWSDYSKYKIFRRYSQFYQLQSELVDRFEKPSVLPVLPPKIYIGRSHVLKVALERKYLIDFYCNKLISLDSQIAKSDLIVEFFSMTKKDLDHMTQKAPSADLEKISKPIESKNYICIHDYKSVTNSELSLNKNEMVDVHMKNATGWWFVSNQYGKGYVPRIVLEATEDLDKQEDEKSYPVEIFDIYIVKKDYTAKNVDEISLFKGDYVKVLEKRLDGWWMVESEDKIGLSPAICITEISIAAEDKKNFFTSGQVSNLSFISSSSSFDCPNYEKLSLKKCEFGQKESMVFAMPNSQYQILNVKNL